jgi:hypothetical protein
MIFLSKICCVNVQTGNAEWLDVNGNDYNSTDSDRVRVGTANPDFTGGITNTFNYKILI